MKNTIEKGSFVYFNNFNNYALGHGGFSKCFYGIDLISGKEIALKFALNQNKIIDYKKEGMLISKLTHINFYPKLYNFNCSDNKEYLGMTIIGPDLHKILNYTSEKFFDFLPLHSSPQLAPTGLLKILAWV